MICRAQGLYFQAEDRTKGRQDNIEPRGLLRHLKFIRHTPLLFSTTPCDEPKATAPGISDSQLENCPLADEVTCPASPRRRSGSQKTSHILCRAISEPN